LLVGSYSNENLKALKKQMLGQITKRVGSVMPIVSIPSEKGLQWIRFDPTNKEMDFMQWLDYCSSLVCGIYSLDPQEINLASRAQAFNGSLITGNQDEMLTQKKDHGLYSMFMELKHLFDKIIKMGGREFQDYEFIWTGIDKVATEKERLENLEKRSFLTINEKRVFENDEEIDVVVPLLGKDVNLADIPEKLIDPFLRAVQMAQQAEMQQGMMEQQEEPEKDEKPDLKLAGEDKEEPEDVAKALSVSGELPRTIRLNISKG